MRKRAMDESHQDESDEVVFMGKTKDDDKATSSTSFMSPVVACILITETAERFSYFGFRAILILYFTRSLQYPDATGIALFAYTTCLAYLSPLLGALLADGHLGRYKTILWFGAIYSVGLCILTTGAYLEGVTEESLSRKRFLTFLGLFLCCIGTGGIKPCVSAFGADQVAYAPSSAHGSIPQPSSLQNSGSMDASKDDSTSGDATDLSGSRTSSLDTPSPSTVESPVTAVDSEARVRAFFASFYFFINLGAVASIMLVPILRAHYGFGTAFLAPTLFIIFAMSVFLYKSGDYIHHVPGQDGTSLAVTFRCWWWLVRQRLSSVPVLMRYMPWLRPTRSPVLTVGGVDTSAGEAPTMLVRQPSSTSDDVQLRDAAQALHVMPIMCLFPIFWMLYDQQDSVWTLQASRMALHGLQPEQLNVVNPVEIMVFIPFFDRCVYPALERRGWNVSHMRRMAWGMLLAALSFFVSGLLESEIQRRDAEGIEQVHVLWQFPQLTILALAEILLSVTGLEFAYATSPDRMKAFLMALYLLTTAVGDFFGGLLYSSVFQMLNGATVMHVCAALMLCNFGLFCYVAHWWEQSEAPYSYQPTSSTDDSREMLDSTKRSISMEFKDYESLGRTVSFKGVEMQSKRNGELKRNVHPTMCSDA